MVGRALPDHFPALDDPRQPGKALLMLCATPADAQGFVEIRLWGRFNPPAKANTHMRPATSDSFRR